MLNYAHHYQVFVKNLESFGFYRAPDDFEFKHVDGSIITLLPDRTAWRYTPHRRPTLGFDTFSELSVALANRGVDLDKAVATLRVALDRIDAHVEGTEYMRGYMTARGQALRNALDNFAADYKQFFQ